MQVEEAVDDHHAVNGAVERVADEVAVRDGPLLGQRNRYAFDSQILAAGDVVVAVRVLVQVDGADDVPLRMRALVRQAMEEGALGVGSSLIYAPAFYADVDELIALNEVAAEYGGRYISHMRSEGAALNQAVDELITIARDVGVGAEIDHLKAAGVENFGKLDRVFEQIEAARAEGLDITLPES